MLTTLPGWLKSGCQSVGWNLLATAIATVLGAWYTQIVKGETAKGLDFGFPANMIAASPPSLSIGLIFIAALALTVGLPRLWHLMRDRTIGYPKIIAFAELTRWMKIAEGVGKKSFACRVLVHGPEPTTLQQQLRKLAYDLRILLKHYHGNFNTDSFTNPEIILALRTRKVPMIRRVSKEIGDAVPFTERDYGTMTVSALRDYANKLEAAARIVTPELLPTVFEDD